MSRMKPYFKVSMKFAPWWLLAHLRGFHCRDQGAKERFQAIALCVGFAPAKKNAPSVWQERGGDAFPNTILPNHRMRGGAR